jgi:hypothetical protein
MFSHLWTREEARKKVQAWYDDLKVKFDDPDLRKEIKNKYNDDSLVYDRGSMKPHVGKRAALKHWKDAFAKFANMTNVVIRITSLVPDPEDPSQKKLPAGDQVVRWDGDITFINKKNGPKETTYPFSGGGQHIDPCDFGNPDSEEYPW